MTPSAPSVEPNHDGRRVEDASVSVAAFNIHGGIDGWGRPYDVADACAALDADVLFLAENLAVGSGPSIAAQIGPTLGYTVHETPFAAVDLAPPFPPDPDEPSWGPRAFRPRERAIRYAEEDRPPLRGASRSRAPGKRATLGLAALCRRPHTAVRIPLPSLAGDPSRRTMLVVTVPFAGGELHVAGVHFGHLSHGSPRQMRAVHAALGERPRTVLCGDMNAWWPVVRIFLGGMRPAVRGPTWPAWRARHQIDHLLVTDDLAVREGSVSAPIGSDHRAIRCVIVPGGSGS